MRGELGRLEGKIKGAQTAKRDRRKKRFFLFLQQLECVAKGEKRESDTTQRCVSACRAEASC